MLLQRFFQFKKVKKEPVVFHSYMGEDNRASEPGPDKLGVSDLIAATLGDIWMVQILNPEPYPVVRIGDGNR